MDCEKLSRINLPRSLQEIGDSAFSGCTKLISVGSIANVSKIGYHAFYSCSSLLSVDISSKVKEIPYYAFMGCVNLTDVGDLSNVTKIGEHAFHDCYNLKRINSLEKVLNYGKESFSGCKSLTTLGKVNTKAKVGTNAFYDCPNLAERDVLDPEASIHDITSDWSLNNASRIGWINIGEYPLNPDYCGDEVVELVNRLCEGLPDDLSKARALYAWVVDNICYDYDKYYHPGMSAWLITDEDREKLEAAGRGDSIFDYSKEDTIIILNRGVCADFCYVYEMMLNLAGIPATTVSCKVISFMNLIGGLHASVMAYIDDEWRFFDPTFDSNGVYSKQEYFFESSNGHWDYFNMDLQQFSEKHFLHEDVGAYEDNVPSAWARDAVWNAQLNHLVPTELQSYYRQSINREDFCKLMINLVEKALGQNIYEYLGSKEIAVKNPFDDTAEPSVSAAYALGIVAGTSVNKFSPHKYITRQEAAVMLSRTAKVLGIKPQSKGAKFTDAKQFASWAANDISFISGLGVMSGIGNGKFGPTLSYTREQAILTALRIYNDAK